MKPTAIHLSPELAACVDVVTSVSNGQNTQSSRATKRASKRKRSTACSAIKYYVGGLTELTESFQINLSWQIICDHLCTYAYMLFSSLVELSFRT